KADADFPLRIALVRGCGEVGYGMQQGVARVTHRAERIPIDRHDAPRSDAWVRRAKEDFHRLAVDAVVARRVRRGRSCRSWERHRAPGTAVEGVLLDIRQQVEPGGAKRAVCGGRKIADARWEMPH